MVDPVLSLSTRTVSLIAFILLVPVVASFRLAPGSRWAEYVGILYHLAMFLLVFKLPAPEWARATGYGWLVLDVVAGALMINHVPRAIAGNVRLGGHIFAGIWFVMASLQGSPAAKLAGLPAGLFLSPIPSRHPFCRQPGLAPHRFSY
jgi:hypothetical protein